MNLQPHDYQLSVFPRDHRAKLKNLAENVCFINDICKKLLLANKMYNLQTHFGFINLWSEVLTFSYISSQKVKKVTRIPCSCYYAEIICRSEFSFKLTYLLCSQVYSGLSTKRNTTINSTTYNCLCKSLFPHKSI